MQYGRLGPRLENQGLAWYRWGGYRISFSDSASFKEKRSFTKFLAGLTRQTLSWGDRRQLMAILSVLHEYAHFEQDLTTGLGHWDFFWRRFLRDRVYGDAQSHYRASDPLAPLPKETEEAILRQRAPLFYVDFADVTQKRELELISRVLREEFSLAPEIVADVARHFTVQSILELDAVCGVYLTLLDLALADDKYEELQSLEQYWRPFTMAPPYADPFIFMFQEITQQSYDGLNDGKIKAITQIIQVLCGLSLAHPSLDWLQAKKQDQRDFHPGVRLVRMMRKLSFDRDQKPRGWSAFEEIVRKTDRFEYPKIRDIYSDWATVLRRDKSAPYAEIVEARAETCDIVSTGRLRPADAGGTSPREPFYLNRSLAGFLDLDLPLLISREDDRNEPMYLTGRALRDPAYMLDIYELDRDLNLTDFFLNRSDGFLCPFGNDSTCKARVLACKDPYRDLRRVPASPDCLVRASLRSLLRDAALG